MLGILINNLIRIKNINSEKVVEVVIASLTSRNRIGTHILTQSIGKNTNINIR